MDIHGRSQPWGKLVKVDTESEVLLVNREYTVGRRKGCDLSFPASKLVSGDHCKIVQDERSGLVWLEDTSTNGTVINMSKLVKKQVHMLQNGDVIYFVYRKNEPELNIAYIYQSIKPERTFSQDSIGNATKCSDMQQNAQPCPVPAAVSVEPFLVGPPWEQQALEEPQPSTSSSSHHLHTFSPSAASLLHSSASGKAEEPNSNLLCSTDVRQTEAQSGVTMLDKEEGDMEPESKRRKTDGADKNYDFGLPHTSSIEVVGPAKGTLIMDLLGKAAVTVEGATTDKMEESLTCIICQDLLHDCVSLQPCMHTFCAACYSGWMERSSLCPTCRCPVERIRKNHILNNLVEAYLIQNPEKCRSEEDLKSMDSHNKITRDMLQPKIERSFSDEEGSSDYLFELSDNDSDTSDISQPFVMCRQCPGYRKEVSQVLWAIGPAPPTPEDRAGKPHGERPSTSSRSDLPTTAPREYMCPPQGSHVICTCCLQPMPDRRAELSAQQCVACQRPFCHMYWGCQRIGCQGCLARFNELNLTDKCLDGVLNSNNYESEILQNYLAARGMSWRDMLQEGLRGLQQGTFYLSDYRINSNAIMCFCCGLRAFKELAYKYRQNIPGSELPAAVTSRPDCYWGRNCRTQVKAHHATKFNHICEQTRFKS
ncbi:E3 ubiquitin-protein ligase CHFR isoform X2 [Salmo salar]|uniref:E3 ubiquitin-protein ligase CHFR n=1 Tax=Salmo salar TaxID=8030 RepID=A0A1S3PG18_SALSA|nr:E3 ubiquitin-protein ligase CHFR isoform X2 [Salmo salar]|eukprot:XP_014026354.1 PREDICTED: E3 ubiquitin-protein ligase CHFR isoform X2 [Salmo salar]